MEKPREGHIPKPHVTKAGLNPTVYINAKTVLKIAWHKCNLSKLYCLMRVIHGFHRMN
jgi:hypothetical protein